MSEEMELICKNLSRHLNCLASENKATRKRALEAIKKEVVKKQPGTDPVILNKVLHELIRPLLTMFSDPVAACREQVIAMLSEIIEQVSDPHDFLQFIIPVLVQRLGQLNVVEPMEEVRLQLVKLMHKLIELNTKRIAPYLDDLIKILQRTITDQFAEVKKESCSCASSLAKAIPEHFHMQSEALIAPLSQKDTLGHQHSKVRVAAIKTIGVVIRYGNGKSVDDVVSPLAQTLFDATPAVRLAVTQVMGEWLLDLPDRYSFHHKLIPLLLTSLTDEYPSIQQEADALWQDIVSRITAVITAEADQLLGGKSNKFSSEKYASENDKDLKDKMDFPKPDPKNYPLGIERPNIGCRTLMYLNFSKILPGLVGDITHSHLVPETRIKSAQLLYALIINEEENVTQHLEKVLTALKEACNDEEKLVREYIFKSAKLLGYFVVPEIWCKVVLQNIRLMQSDKPSDSLPGSLSLLAAFIQGSEKESLQPHLADITDVIGVASICRFPATPLQSSLLLIVESIIQVSEENCRCASQSLFNVLISVIALHRQDIVKEQAEKLLIDLAKVQQLTDREHLFQLHLKPMLDAMEPSYQSWTQHSEERFIFDTLLLQAGPVVNTVLDNVMKVLLANLSPAKDPDVRSKFFSLLSHLITSSSNITNSERSMSDYVVTIIHDMILPNCVWKAGRTAEVIRKMAVVCLRILLNKEGLVTVDQLASVMDDLITQLRSTLDDDNRETRLLTCQVLSKIFFLVGDRLHRDHRLYNMYPELLKRLDDSSDDVRIAATETFSAYFGCLCKEYEVALYRAHLEEIFKGLLLHMDDPQEEVQMAVLETLKTGAHVQPDMLLKEIEAARHKLRSTTSCDQLVTFINSLPKPA